MLVYHCTWTRLVPRILKQGLRPLQTSNWVNGNGAPYRDGAIYVFASRWDAIRWAARMDWDGHKATGTGKVSILTITHDDTWDIDHADTLSQASCEGLWLKAFCAIPASAITAVEPLTTDLVRSLVAHNHQPQEAK